MDKTLKDLGDLLVEAIPTIVFFILLTVYLKHVFFRPLARILEERRKATEGVRELARQAFEAADKKNAEFEHALQIARSELHQEHEALRRQWSDEQAQLIAQARADADQRIQQAKQQIALEVKRAETALEAKLELLGEQIVQSVTARRAA
jgi:F0F1-type ATP synthase membrane subunit b/b'